MKIFKKFGIWLAVAIILLVYLLLLFKYEVCPTFLHTIILSLAVIIGGIFTLYKFILHRLYETALTINIDLDEKIYLKTKMLIFKIRISNIGKTKITGRKNNTETQNAYENKKDEYTNKDVVKFCCELQVRKINSFPIKEEVITWYTNKHVNEIIEFEHINLLEEHKIGRAHV